MLKFTGYALLLIGVFVLVFTGYQFYQTKAQSDELLEEAHAMLAEEKKDSSTTVALKTSADDDHSGTKEAASAAEGDHSGTKESTPAAEGDHSGKKEAAPAAEGDLVGILRIPDIDLEVSITEGTKPQDMRSGVGHESSSSMPGQGNQVFLAGHNDSTFRRAGELKNGDVLIMETPQGTFTYTMYAHEIVHESETDVITPGDEETLVLMTCYPFTGIGSPTERYLIYAKPK
ncbi:class D sortase [Terribacillus saccharophilus]|uniref:class D sortase n=1 Tax=Terribacillus saccharophilus TaxID=361277 RepID=UPI003981BFE2